MYSSKYEPIQIDANFRFPARQTQERSCWDRLILQPRTKTASEVFGDKVEAILISAGTRSEGRGGQKCRKVRQHRELPSGVICLRKVVGPVAIPYEFTEQLTQ